MPVIIVQNFLNLATKTQLEKRSFDLNDVAGNILALREYDHKVHDVVAVPALEQDLPKVLGDLGQIEQVILNLVVNAEDVVRATQDRTGEIESARRFSTAACDWKSQTTETVFNNRT